MANVNGRCIWVSDGYKLFGVLWSTPELSVCEVMGFDSQTTTQCEACRYVLGVVCLKGNRTVVVASDRCEACRPGPGAVCL